MTQWCSFCSSKPSEHKVSMEIESVDLELEACNDCLDKMKSNGLEV